MLSFFLPKSGDVTTIGKRNKYFNTEVPIKFYDRCIKKHVTFFVRYGIVCTKGICSQVLINNLNQYSCSNLDQQSFDTQLLLDQHSINTLIVDRHPIILGRCIHEQVSQHLNKINILLTVVN